MARNIIFSAAALLVSSAVAYTIYLRQSLARKIKYEEARHILSYEPLKDDNVESLPDDLFQPGLYHVAADRASKSVTTANLPQYDDPNILLTKYLQKNMSAYARSPQSVLPSLFYSPPEIKQTFWPSFVRSLDFVSGNVVYGTFRVEHRTPNKVEFGMVPLKGLPPMNGRLVISIQDHGAQTEFITRTIQWRKAGKKFALPIERKSIAWLHELTSFWLLESGTGWLCSLNDKS